MSKPVWHICAWAMLAVFAAALGHTWLEQGHEDLECGLCDLMHGPVDLVETPDCVRPSSLGTYAAAVDVLLPHDAPSLLRCQRAPPASFANT